MGRANRWSFLKLDKKNLKHQIQVLKARYKTFTLTSIKDIKTSLLYKRLNRDTAFICKVESQGVLDDFKAYYEQNLYTLKHIYFFIFLSPRLYKQVSKSKKKSQYQEFKEAVIVMNPRVRRSMIYELYRRIGNDLDKAKEYVINKDITTLAKLNKVLPISEKIYYTSDIINYYLDNSYMKEKEYIYAVNLLLNQMGSNYLLNTLRKQVKSLYFKKLHSLINNNEDFTTTNLRINEILTFYITLENIGEEEVRIVLLNKQKAKEGSYVFL